MVRREMLPHLESNEERSSAEAEIAQIAARYLRPGLGVQESSPILSRDEIQKLINIDAMNARVTIAYLRRFQTQDQHFAEALFMARYALEADRQGDVEGPVESIDGLEENFIRALQVRDLMPGVVIVRLSEAMRLQQESGVPAAVIDSAIESVVRQLPEPEDSGPVADFIGKDFLDRLRTRLTEEGYPDSWVDALLVFLEAPTIPGAAWINPETGEVEGSKLLIRLMDHLSRMSDPSREGVRARGEAVRESLFHEYMHQILSEVVSRKELAALREDIGILDQDFMIRFTQRYGTDDVEEVLAKYLSLRYGRRDESLQLFGLIEARLGAFLEGRGIYAMDLPKGSEAREKMKGAMEEADPAFLERFQQRYGLSDLKSVFLQYRRLKLLADLGRLDEQARGDLELFNSVQLELDMYLNQMSLADLIEGPQKAVLARVIKQVRHRINLRQGETIDRNIRTLARRLASFGNRYLAKAQDEAEKFLSRRVYVLDHRLYFKATDKEGSMFVQDSGLRDTLQSLLSVHPNAQIVMPSPLSRVETERLLLSLGFDETILQSGRIQIVKDVFATGKLEDMYAAIGYTGKEGMERAETEVVALLTEDTRARMVDMSEFSGRMKIAVGRIGKARGEALMPDVVALGYILGSVERAFEDGRIHPAFDRQLREFFLDVFREYRRATTDEEVLPLIDELMDEIQKNGFFKMPPPTDSLNEKMRSLAIEESYFEVAA